MVSYAAAKTLRLKSFVPARSAAVSGASGKNPMEIMERQSPPESPQPKPWSLAKKCMIQSSPLNPRRSHHM